MSEPIINRIEDMDTHELLEYVDDKRGAYMYKIIDKNTKKAEEFNSFSEAVAYLNDNYK